MNLPTFHFHDLQRRVILLTGAANGIGRELALNLASQGCRLILLDKDAAGLQATADFIRNGAKPPTCETIACDLAQAKERQKAVRHVQQSTQVVDGIIHNAAIDPRSSLENTSLDFFRHVMATNVEPAVEMTRDLLPNLRRSEAARIILIGSVTFEIGTGLLSAYVASKGALVGLTRSLAHELGKDGITVNCIAPGAIAVEKEQARTATIPTVVTWQAVKRRLVPQDLFGITSLLLSTAGGGITGQVITVDGGLIHPIADPDFQTSLRD